MSPKTELSTTEAVSFRISNPEFYVQLHLCQGFLPTVQPDSLLLAELEEGVAVMS